MQLCGSRAPGTAVQARAARAPRRAVTVRCEAGSTVKPAVDTIELGKSGELSKQRQPIHARNHYSDLVKASVQPFINADMHTNMLQVLSAGHYKCCSSTCKHPTTQLFSTLSSWFIPCFCISASRMCIRVLPDRVCRPAGARVRHWRLVLGRQVRLLGLWWVLLLLLWPHLRQNSMITA
jgi:hypothetical protein